MSIETWRAAFEGLLTGASRVIAPSRDVASRISRYFPTLQPLVMPHFDAAPVASPSIVRVMTLGMLSPEKGLHVVRACAEDARARGLPLAFKVLGATTQPLPQWPELPLSIHGQYGDEDLAGLVAGERPDVIWLPAQVPETYAYTLTVALQSGVPIVASALGAFPERLASSPRATLVRWNATPREWNDALLGAIRVATPKRRSFPAKVAAS
jgi:glycosyltransferase involved in cell wall biosynthesis